MFIPKQDPAHIFTEEEEEEEEEEKKADINGDDEEKAEITDDATKEDEDEEVLDETTTITKVYEEVCLTIQLQWNLFYDQTFLIADISLQWTLLS